MAIGDTMDMNRHMLWHRDIRAQDMMQANGRSPYPITTIIGDEYLHPDGRIEPCPHCLDSGIILWWDNSNTRYALGDPDAPDDPDGEDLCDCEHGRKLDGTAS